ncbi:MAG: hypothetical protein JWO62_1026 [Acidimicrobiaceae bacterium]|nr:hypothetical protein [Acidimicrobiaceae bacterium]
MARTLLDASPRNGPMAWGRSPSRRSTRSPWLSPRLPKAVCMKAGSPKLQSVEDQVLAPLPVVERADFVHLRKRVGAHAHSVAPSKHLGELVNHLADDTCSADEDMQVDAREPRTEFGENWTEGSPTSGSIWLSGRPIVGSTAFTPSGYSVVDSRLTKRGDCCPQAGALLSASIARGGSGPDEAVIDPWYVTWVRRARSNDAARRPVQPCRA